MRVFIVTICLLVLNVISSDSLLAQVADTVFTGGKVYTLDNSQPWAEAVAVKGNKIIYVGDAEGVKQHIGDETKTVDCTGKTVMPGFVSVHDHLIASAWTNAGVQLFDAKDKAECLKRIKEYAEANPDEKVIRGSDGPQESLAAVRLQPNWIRRSMIDRRSFSISRFMTPGSTRWHWKKPTSPKKHLTHCLA